ncbi:unnamed protein product [Enterobius vermicularis]|uniref:MI domain-containing protein n=1 Tax=Enterobius vermicularis TaxID=51028 RepID=A0A0N4V1G1_ENTVE|nr:unnamed protein product [Enterobius vermicularis]
MQQTGGDGNAATVGNSLKFVERRANQPESAIAATKAVHEPSHRTARHSTNSPHNRSGGDELRGSTRTGSPHTGSRVQSNTLIRASSSSSSTTSCPQKTKHSSTVNSLRSFQKNFDNAYQPNQAPQSHSSVEDAQANVSSNSSGVNTGTAQQPINAWMKGPPSSIRSPPSQSAQQNVNNKGATTSETAAPALPTEISQKSRDETPVQAVPVSSVTTAHSSSASSTSLPQSTGNADSTRRMSGSGPSSPPATQTVVTNHGTCVQQMTSVSSTAGTPVLSTNGSSSSIAPIDPQPSISSSASSTGNTSTPQPSGKKFEFNPDATPFTPRFATSHTSTPRSTPAPAPAAAVHATHPVHQLSVNPAQNISVAQSIPSGVITQPNPPFSFTPNTGVYSPLHMYYSAQPVLPMGTQIAQVSASPAAAGVAGGPMVAGGASVPGGRTGQVTASTAGPRRAQLFSGGPLYISNAVPYGPPVIPQYPVNIFTSPFQQLSVGTASIPPPTVPPPASSSVAVGAASQPLQILPTQQQHSQAAYATRQYYQPSQNCLVAAAPAPRGYAPQHQTIEYNGNGQQPSSAASSNGNGSNGHNSQPATPGPQPIASPAQIFNEHVGKLPLSPLLHVAHEMICLCVANFYSNVAYPSATNTPQPAHSFLMQIQSGPSHHPQHMYVQPPSAFYEVARFLVVSASCRFVSLGRAALLVRVVYNSFASICSVFNVFLVAWGLDSQLYELQSYLALFQFPFVPNPSYMMYNPQQVMQLSAIPSAPISLSQPSQPVTIDHYPNMNETHSTSQHNANSQTHGSMPSQQYLSTDQAYGQYLHGS